jgi:hypothetical protein
VADGVAERETGVADGANEDDGEVLGVDAGAVACFALSLHAASAARIMTAAPAARNVPTGLA